jgi:ubiquitin-conjugating enzyme E2 variant
MDADTRSPEGWISPCRDANLRALTAPAPSAPPAADGAAGVTVGEEQRPFWVKAFDVASVTALLVLLALVTARLVHVLGAVGASRVTVLPTAAVAAVLAADLVSGLVHWTCDRFFSETTPVIGRMLIHPFREHHRDPRAITRHGLFELCGNNALAVLLPVAGLVAAGAPRPTAQSVAVHGFVISFATAVFATNQFHKWAHAERCAAPVRWLQRARLILSPEVHDRHHRGDFSAGYCVTTGWLNPLLDACRVLRRCEAWLRARDVSRPRLRSRRAS